MFQRQLSTTALGSSSGSSSSAQSNTGAGKHSSPATGHRLFQRQATASQLFSSSSSATNNDGLNNKQRAAALLAGARDSASSATNLSTARRSPVNELAAFGSGSGFATPEASGEPKKKATKNKRIISRMLSISAIHTTVTGGGSSQAHNVDNSGLQAAQIGTNSNSSFNHSTEHSDANSATPTTTTTNSMGDQTRLADKIDSSFTRSRSSSTSSTTALAPTSEQPATSGESILSMCFLDWTQSGHQAAAGGVSQAHITTTTTTNSAASPAASNTPLNNKSLGSIDNSTAGPSQLALYLGTSQGCVLLVSLTMPDSEDNRVLQLQSVNAEPIPQATLKLAGSILCLATLNIEGGVRQQPISGGSTGAAPSSGGQLASPALSLENEPTGSGAATGSMRHQDSSPQSSFESRVSTFLTVVSQKQAKVYQVPRFASTKSDHHHHHHHKSPSIHQQEQLSGPDSPIAKMLINKSNLCAQIELSETSFACRTSLVQMRQPDEYCLVSYMGTGNVVVHSMPKLRPLMDADLVPYSNPRIASSMCFSKNGHCLYKPSESEISKFTISSQYKALINDMTGLIYVPRDMPEMPRGNFFKSLFSVTSSAASKQSDRDELFGECSAGKAQRGLAKHISTSGASSGLEKLKGAAIGTMGHDMRIAREGLDERGEKLSEIEDRTLQMLNQSESYSQAAHQLAQKFKDKKWYQF